MNTVWQREDIQYILDGSMLATATSHVDFKCFPNESESYHSVEYSLQ